MKNPKHCSLDLDNWKFYLEEDKITTNSRWVTSLSEHPSSGTFVIPKRTDIPKITKELKENHHGIWIEEIPYQMIKRFSKENDLVWSVFGGTGIDYEIATHLNRQCVVNDINPKRDFIQFGDSRTFKPCHGQEVSLALLHPPYWDMVKYSEKEEDGSSKKTLKEFLEWFKEIEKNVDKHLKKDGFVVLACGNLYKNSEEIELGEILKYIFLSDGYTLKQHIIKDYGETKGSSARNYNVNYYRQLRGGYGNFYGDNIYILKKSKSKNNITGILKEIL